MEEPQNTPQEEKKEQKSQHVIAAIAFIVVLIIIAVLVMKPADEVVAPIDENIIEEPSDSDFKSIATSTEEANAATNTPENTQIQGGFDLSAGTESIDEDGNRVVTGDGFVATIREVEREDPIINEFSARLSASGETCFYSWNVSKAQNCNLITGVGTGISNIGTEGSIQIVGGAYLLECDGIGGGKTTSDVVKCEGE